MKMSPKPPAPVLTEGEMWTPEDAKFPCVDSWSPTYADMHEPFELMKYTVPRLPIDLGQVDLDEIQKCPSVLRMILKWGNEEDVYLPKELLNLKPLMDRIFRYDKCVNRDYKEQFAHITIHVAEVDPGVTQRFPGWHGDDLQSGSFDPKVNAAHSYIITSAPATEFCLQPFFVAHLNDLRENIFKAFDQQAREENVYRIREGHLYLMDPYSVHRSPVVTKAGVRIFLRVTFSDQMMLMPRGTFNPGLSDREDPIIAPHQDDWYWLVDPDTDISWHRYGVRNEQTYWGH